MKIDRNEPGIHVRIAVPDDALPIASLLHDSFIEYKSLYTDEGFADTTPKSDQIERRIHEGPVWVALYNGVIVGTVSAVPKGEALYVRGMAVLPTARGGRIGDLLFRHMESFASAHGYKRLFLSTTSFLSRAIRLYERLGFQRSSEGPPDLFGTPLFTMVKTIGSSD